VGPGGARAADERTWRLREWHGPRLRRVRGGEAAREWCQPRLVAIGCLIDDGGGEIKELVVRLGVRRGERRPCHVVRLCDV
jgi:hypothetical protein